MTGWIKLHRKIQDHWIWQDAEKLKWWLDLLMLVNYDESKVLKNGSLITVGIGEILTSELQLAERWKADRKTVHKFLLLLAKDDMITLLPSKKNGTTIKVSNYAGYQDKLDNGAGNGMDNGMDNSQGNGKDNDGSTEGATVKELKEFKELEKYNNNAHKPPKRNRIVNFEQRSTNYDAIKWPEQQYLEI